MMWFTKFLDENTIYWAPPTKSGLGTGYIWPEPVDILARWQYNNRQRGSDSRFYSAEGTSLMRKITVWASQELEPDGYLKLGLVDDLPPGFEPNETTDAIRIDTTEKVRSLNFNNILYKAYLDEG